MKRIDSANVDEDLFGAGKDGFRAAVPGVSDPTYLNAKWFNHVQEAIVRTIEQAGLALADDYDQFVTALNTIYAKLASPAFTGTPTAPTAAAGINTTQLATTAFANRVLNGRTAKSVAGGVDVILSAAEAGVGILNFTGALTANINVIVPAVSGRWIVENSTTGAFLLTVKTPAGTGVVVAQGAQKEVYCDATNVRDARTEIASESAIGMAKIATQGQVDAGTDDTTFITPKKLLAWANAKLFGMGQTWSNVTASRAINTTYTNTTGAPITVTAMLTVPTSGAGRVLVDGAEIAVLGSSSSGAFATLVTFVVQAGATYGTSGISAITRWTELS